MGARCLFSFIHIAVLCVFAEPHFNFEELNMNQYSFQLSSEPVLRRTESDNSIMYMKSKYGQQYECNLPEVTSEKNINQEESYVEKRPISELLEPMKSSSCLIKVRDWWTYEFCYGREIKQYHYEEGKGIIGDQMSLGNFESDFDWDNITDDSPNKKQMYHSQYYSNGTKCDLTGKPRQTEVRFFCDEGNIQYFARIDEPSSCHYIIEIHTDRICRHPYTKPAFKIKPKQISCSPVLNAEQYNSYKQAQEVRRQKAEEKKRQWLLKEKAKLDELKKQNNKLTSEMQDNLQNTKDEGISEIKTSRVNEDVDKIDQHLDNYEDNIEDEVNDDIKLLEHYLLEQMEKLKKQNNYAKASEEDKVSDNSSTKEDVEEKSNADGSKLEDGESPHVDEENKKRLSSWLRRIQLKLKKKLDATRTDGQDNTAADSATSTPPDKSTDTKVPESESASDTESQVKDKVDEETGNKNVKLKESINEKLAQAGLNTGQKIQIKIIRVNDDDEVEEWSDQTTNDVANSVQKTIIAYVQGGGMRDSIKQMVKQQQLEHNYKFVWTEKSKSEKNDKVL